MMLVPIAQIVFRISKASNTKVRFAVFIISSSFWYVTFDSNDVLLRTIPTKSKKMKPAITQGIEPCPPIPIS